MLNRVALSASRCTSVQIDALDPSTYAYQANTGVHSITLNTPTHDCPGTPPLPHIEAEGACRTFYSDYYDTWSGSAWSASWYTWDGPEVTKRCPGITFDGLTINFDTDDGNLVTDSTYTITARYCHGDDYSCTESCGILCDDTVTYTFDVTISSNSSDPYACYYTGYTTDSALTGQTFYYDRLSGSTTKNFDTITGTTGESCQGYTAWTYYLRATEYAAESLSDIGMSVDNSQDPAQLIVAYDDYYSPKTQTYVLTWYAQPDDHPWHPQITQTFTWVSYTALTDVTHTTLPASIDVYIGVAGQELAFPTWTTTPANLNGQVTESNFNYAKTELFDPYSSYNMWVNGVQQIGYDWDTVDATNKKWLFSTDDVSYGGKSYTFSADWTWDDTQNFNEIFPFSFQVNIICQVSSTTGTVQTNVAYVIFSGALPQAHTIYTQNPVCDVTPVVELTWSTDNSSFNAISGLTAWTLSYDQSSYTITANDYSLHNVQYYIKQKTTYNGAYYDEYSFPVVFTDPCETTVFVAQTILDAVNFITVDIANVVPNVVTALPRLTDSANEQYGSSPHDSICHTQNLKAEIEGVAVPFVRINDASTEFLLSSTSADDKGEYQVDFTYTLSRYNLITTVISSKVTLYLLEDPNDTFDDQKYIVNSRKMTINVNFFTIDPQSSNIKISHSLEMSNGSAVPSFIKLIEDSQTKTCQIVVESSDPSIVSDYKLKVRGTAEHTSGIQVSLSTQEINLSVQSELNFGIGSDESSEVGLGPISFDNLSSNLNKYNLLEMLDERINLGKVNTHNVTGTPKVVSFEIIPESFAYHIQFSLAQTQLLVDYQSMIKHMDATTPQIQANLVMGMDGNLNTDEQSEYIFIFQGYQFQRFSKTLAIEKLEDTTLSLWSIFGQDFGSNSDKFIEATAQPVTTNDLFFYDVHLSSLTILEPLRITGLLSTQQVSFVVTKIINKDQYTWFDLFFVRFDSLSTSSGQLALPRFQSIQIDNYGVALVQFSDAVFTTELSKFDKSALEVKVYPRDDDHPDFSQEKFALSWELIEFQPKLLRMQLKFSNPEYLSANAPEDSEILQIKCVNPSYFLRKKDLRVIAENSTITATIPPQIASDSNLAQQLSDMEVGAKSATLATLVVNLAMSQSLGGLFDALNSLQLMVHMSKFSAQAPINVSLFDERLAAIVNFDLVPTDDFFTTLSLAKPEEELEDEELQPDDVQGRTLRSESQGLMNNIDFDEYRDLTMTQGSYIIAAFVALATSIVICLLQPLRKKYVKIEKFVWHQKNELYWNSTSRAFLEAYLNLSLGCLALIKYHLKWDSTINSIQSAAACITVALLIILPAYITCFLRKNYKKFRKASFKQKYGSIIENLDFKNKHSSIEISLFCYRRLLQAALIVLYNSRYFFQIQLMTISITLAVVIANNNTLRGNQRKRLNLFNETSLLVHCYTYFLFSAYLPDPIVRFSIGKIVILNTIVNFIVNAFFIVKESCAGARKIHLQKRYDRKWMKHRKEMLEIKDKMRAEKQKLEKEQEQKAQVEAQAAQNAQQKDNPSEASEESGSMHNRKATADKLLSNDQQRAQPSSNSSSLSPDSELSVVQESQNEVDSEQKISEIQALSEISDLAVSSICQTEVMGCTMSKLNDQNLSQIPTSRKIEA